MSHARAVIAGGLLVLLAVLAANDYHAPESEIDLAIYAAIIVVVIIILLLDVDVIGLWEQWKNRKKED